MSQAAPRLRIRSTSYVVIPARLASTRLPRKLLLSETGKPLLQHTYEAAQRAKQAVGHVRGGRSRGNRRGRAAFRRRSADDQPRLRQRHRSRGRDRPATATTSTSSSTCRETSRSWPVASIDRVIELLEANPDMVMSTLATPIRSRAVLDDPACVKVVFDGRGRALYFSRSPIPHARDVERSSCLTADPPHFYQHVGLYAYRRDFLLRLAALPRTPLEKLENLEQLRVLETGYSNRRRRGRRADRRHRHARGLSGVCQPHPVALR